MCGIANLQQIENEIKRRANRRPVHWGWKVAMFLCAGMVLWFLASPVYEWAGQRAAEQAAAGKAAETDGGGGNVSDLTPICVKCRLEMRCAKNNRVVADPESGGFRSTYWFGDEYECPDCGCRIVTGFGESTTVRPSAQCGPVLDFEYEREGSLEVIERAQDAALGQTEAEEVVT